MGEIYEGEKTCENVQDVDLGNGYITVYIHVKIHETVH